MSAFADDRRTMIIAMIGATLISFAPLMYVQSASNPTTGAFFRMFYALPILALLVWIQKGEDERDYRARTLTFTAGILLAIDYIGYHSGIDFIGSGIATMIGNTQVVIVTLSSWVLFNERPNKLIILALPLVMLGLLLISGIWDEDSYGSDPVKGVIAGVVAAIFYSAFLILYRFSNRVQAPSVNLLLDGTAGAAFGLFIIGIAPLSAIGVQAIDFTPSWPSHGWLVLLALSCQVIGWIGVTYALPRLPAAHTSFALLLQPILTILWGITLLNEEPSLQQIIGMILIFSSIIAVTLFGSSESPEIS